MKIITESISLLSSKELKDRMIQFSRFMGRDFAEYWDQENNKLNDKIRLPLLKLKDPLIKNNNLKVVVGDVIEIKEKIIHGDEILHDSRLRIVV